MFTNEVKWARTARGHISAAYAVVNVWKTAIMCQSVEIPSCPQGSKDHSLPQAMPHTNSPPKSMGMSLAKTTMKIAPIMKSMPPM
jgi:hypothetical protein